MVDSLSDDNLSVGSGVSMEGGEKDNKSFGDSSTSQSGGAGQQPSRDPVLVQRESKYVFYSKALVLFVLLFATAGAASATYLFTRQEELNDFSVRFEDFANQVISVSSINIERVFEIYENLGRTVANYAWGTGAEWPFVTFPNFDSQARPAVVDNGARFVGIIPFVKADQQEEWEAYAVANQGWVQDGLNYQGINETAQPIFPHIFRPGKDRTPLTEPIGPHYAPVWQEAPAKVFPLNVNYEGFGFPSFPAVYSDMLEFGESIFSEVWNLDPEADTTDENNYPRGFIGSPIHDVTTGEIVGMAAGVQPWDRYFANLVPDGIDGIVLVIANECGQEFSYLINGPKVQYLGVGDLHDPIYDEYEVISSFDLYRTANDCVFDFHLYPTRVFEKSYTTNRPWIYTFVVVGIFCLTASVFILYDCLVERRQDKVMTTATKTTAIVNSLFPATVRDRLIENDQEGDTKQHKVDLRNPFAVNNTAALMEAQTSGSIPTRPGEGKPIADLFPAATVLFADIVGFTAWSSVREPTQVFTLLETVYNSFDKIAKRLRVFKVETIGDCYVAAAGLPEARNDHAIVMARFARDCLVKMNQVVHRLEFQLGPETADLCMRFGLHSGPVTAGVLRGEKSRFQLFGDTVNTAARMESTGAKNQVQLSQATANLLTEGGKTHWMRPRETKVNVKGKGELQTYWLDFGSASTVTGLSSSIYQDATTPSMNPIDSNASTTSSNDGTVVGGATAANSGGKEQWALENVPDTSNDKMNRLIGWNVDVLQGLLKKVIAMRGINTNKKRFKDLDNFKAVSGSSKGMVLDEVKEIIALPSKAANYAVNPASVKLSEKVQTLLTDFVTSIAAMYHPNAFHSFEHASHVTQSVTKLLARVVTPASLGTAMDLQTSNKSGVDQLHQFTFGITSDPITQFACAFSALIHDVDHPGLPNTQLVKEQTRIAVLYKNKSVAEQHSVDLAWGLLMEDKYKPLRDCIYQTQEELDRFRQLVVNCVMATDIVDKELGALRRKRWEKAFDGTDILLSPGKDSSQDAVNRKATIVIEHLIQASDVAHTMQHWHVYIKWNERFFMECYKAYQDGRAEKDPSEGWYKGELGFYDFYIIPLAKKLKECGVFGVSSDEYLNYAEANRQEWETKGESIVKEYLARYHASKKDDEKSTGTTGSTSSLSLGKP